MSNITSPKKTYGELLQSPEWQKCRLSVLKRDKFTCKLCKDKKTTLHVHHKSYQSGKLPWEYPITNFMSLCSHCHKLIENFKEWEFPKEKIESIKSVVKNIGDGYVSIGVLFEGSIFLGVYNTQGQVDMHIHLGPVSFGKFLPLIKALVKNG
jgi:hypothetical protein